jgi:hypothetical protein
MGIKKSLVLCTAIAILGMNASSAGISEATLTEAKNIMRSACSSRMAERAKEQKQEVSPKMMGVYTDICNCIIDDARLKSSIEALAQVDQDTSKMSAAEIKAKGDRVEADFEKASDPIITECAKSHAADLAGGSDASGASSTRGADAKSNE